MAKTLKKSVSLTDPETGNVVTLQAGDEVPSNLADKITNPGAFEDEATADPDKVPGDSQTIFVEDSGDEGRRGSKRQEK